MWIHVPAAEIAMLDGYIVVYKFVQDLHFFVTAGDDENELIFVTVLQGFYDAIGNLLRSVAIVSSESCFNLCSISSRCVCISTRIDVGNRTALENLDVILLCIDEIVDGGYELANSFLCNQSYLGK